MVDFDDPALADLRDGRAQVIIDLLVRRVFIDSEIEPVLRKAGLSPGDYPLGQARLVWLTAVPDAARRGSLGALVRSVADAQPAILAELEERIGKLAGSALLPPKKATLVFLCHSSGDKERVRALYLRFKRDGVKCWFDEEDLLPGQKWEYEIRRAIKRSKFVLACLSRASIAKTGFVQKELKLALDVADEQPEGGIFLIPVRLEECEVPDRLSDLQWVDMFADRGYERLLRVLSPPSDEGPNAPSDAEERRVESTQDDNSAPVVYSSNDFNVAIQNAIQQAWWNCFGERTHMYAPRDYTKRPDGGVDGLIWPLDKPAVKVSFRTFPSPEIKLRSDEAIEMMKHSDTPCLIVTRLPLNQWTRDAIERSYSPPVQFLHWTGSDDDKKLLETSIRKLRESLT